MKKLSKELFKGKAHLAIHIGDNPEMDKIIQKLLINRGYSWNISTGVTDEGRLNYKETYAIRVSSLDGILKYSTKGIYEESYSTYVYQSVSEFIEALQNAPQEPEVTTIYGHKANFEEKGYVTFFKPLPEKLFNNKPGIVIHVGDNEEIVSMINKLLIDRGYFWLNDSETKALRYGKIKYGGDFCIEANRYNGKLYYSELSYYKNRLSVSQIYTVPEFIKALEEQPKEKTIKTSYGSYILTDAVLTNERTEEKYYTLDIIQAFKIVSEYDISGNLLVGEHKMYAGEVKELYEALQTSNVKHQVNKLYINKKG